MKYAISIDIGGTNTRVALVDETLTIIDKQTFITHANNPQSTIEHIKQIIDGFAKPLVGIGISCPGPLDLKQGVVLTPPNLPGWHMYPLAKSLENMIQLPVFLENDANLAALAEATVGAGINQKVVQYLTISTGIGGGCVVDGDIYTGAHGFAQEIANVIVWPNGPIMNDLKPGALEAVSSGTAITYRAQTLGMNVDHAGDVNDLAKAGEVTAQGIIDDAKVYLANAIAALYAFNDPSIVVLGGSVALKIEGFIEDIETHVKSNVYDVLRDLICIVPASLNDDSGLIGGAILAFKQQK